MDPNRRSFLSGAVAAGVVPKMKPPGQLFNAPLVPFRTSLSVGPLTEATLRATTLTDGDYTATTRAELQKLFMRHGATEVYARIAMRKFAPQKEAPDAEHGWAHGLESARLARDLGLPFNPELGLWASYGDGGTYQQPPDFCDYPSIQLPGPWLSLKLEQMLPPLRQYGALIARQILQTGVYVNVWDIGNEVESGIAGVTVRPIAPTESYQAPDMVDPAIGTMSVLQLMKMSESDQIAWCTAHIWPHVGRLIAATAEGIRSVDSHARFSTHIAPVGHKTPAVHLAFWRIMKESGYLPDQCGFSYYAGMGKSLGGPEDTFEWFKQTATALKAEFGRQVFIAEGGIASGKMPPPFIFNDPVADYPTSNAGQHDFNRDLIAWGVKSGCLAGYRPWAVEYCTKPGWAPMSWFTASSNKLAKAKPALSCFEEALPCIYVWVGGRTSNLGPVPIKLRLNRDSIRNLTVELRRGQQTLADCKIPSVGVSWTAAEMKGTRGAIPSASYTLTVRSPMGVLLERNVTIHR